MSNIVSACSCTAHFLTDGCLFFAIQALLVLFVLLIIVFDTVTWCKTGFNFNVNVTRGPKSMATFYGAYGVFTSIFVTLCISVDTAKDHRVLFVFLDTLLIGYACLFNRWFRGKLIGMTNKLPTREFNGPQ